MKQNYFTLLILAFTVNISYSQTNDVIEITTIGSGNTIENAKFNALRSALEQVSGAYLSANTLIINDKLISDNITSIAAGSIESYEVIDQIEKEKLFYLTIKSKVSPKKFAEFVSGKVGTSVSVKGGIYVANIKQLNFNEEAELKAVKQLGDLYSELLYNSIYYDAEVMSPVEEKLLNERKNHDQYYLTFQKLPIIVTMHFTVAIDSANKYLKNNLKLICLSEDEIENYKKINRKIYPICIDGDDYFFRNKESLFSILKLNKYENNIDYVNSFTINDGNCIFKRYINLKNNDINLKFTNDLIYIKYLDYYKNKIKGYSSEDYCYKGGDAIEYQYLCNNNFITYRRSESKSEYCIQLWKSDAYWPTKLNGYYTLDEIEKINEIEILKNVSPKINYTIKTK
jgi:hypothetical protein